MKPGPVVVITGGSAGAGRAAARAFAQKGFQVGLLARGLERLEAARREVEGSSSTRQLALQPPVEVDHAVLQGLLVGPAVVGALHEERAPAAIDPLHDEAILRRALVVRRLVRRHDLETGETVGG